MSVVKVDVIRSRVAVTIDGVDYNSRTDAAKALVAAGKSVSEAAKMAGCTTATVYSVTKGAAGVANRRAKYRILSLAKTGKKTASEIATRVGVSTPKVVSLLKKSGLVVPTKEALAKLKSSANAVKESEAKVKADAKAAKKAAKAAAKATEPTKPTKTKKVKKVSEVVEPIVTDEMFTGVIDNDQDAMEAAMADMAIEAKV